MNPFTLAMLPIGFAFTAASYAMQATHVALGSPPGEPFRPPAPSPDVRIRQGHGNEYPTGPYEVW